ncbi:MAG: bifunctional diaminohydroxyphosphoribosylaminopyrimidine deaminase/5-amino-6-(5-phosphoribosylamino)uracil reductase RibD [Sulfobacillus sp.]
MDQVAWMARALELAELGRGFTSPNPLVGCVVVKDGEIVGEGYHRGVGLPHAEAEALAAAGERAVGADLYVSLEPCCHFGRTPPCTAEIIGHRVARVFAAIADPNPRVSLRSKAELEAAGIPVSFGLLAERATSQNAAYLKWVDKGLPFVSLKWAMTLDGKVACHNGDSMYFTGQEALARAHLLRREADAVAVGLGTVLRDDPQLTVRHVSGRSPARVVFDSHLALPATSRLLAPGGPPLVVIGCESASQERKTMLTDLGATVLLVPGFEGRVDLLSALRLLARHDITSLLVEGGPTLHGSFVDQHLADRFFVFLAPSVFGNPKAPSAVGGLGVDHPQAAPRLTMVRMEALGEDLFIEARPEEVAERVHRHHPAERAAVGQ